MPRYNYFARDPYGHPIHGTMVAESDIELSERLRNLGYVLTRVKTIKEGIAAELPKRLGQLKPRELLNFTIHLATLINSGVPLLASLTNLVKSAEGSHIQAVIGGIRKRVEAGSSLKEAISHDPRSFPKLYYAIVGAGEATGKLGTVLNDLATYLEWQLDLRSKVKEASTYPTILFCVMILVVIVLLVRVIPAFESLFKEMDIILPLPTLIILGLSSFIRQFWYIFVLGTGILFAAYKFYRRTSKGRYRIDSFKLKIPLFGTILRKVALSRFCHTMSLTLSSGMTLLPALDIGAEVVGNERLNQVALTAKESVNVGERLASSLALSKEFPSLVVTMVEVGEESGALVQSFDKVSQFYDKEVPATIKRFFTIFEPAMIIFMGIVVGGIALSVLLPLIRLIEVVGG